MRGYRGSWDGGKAIAIAAMLLWLALHIAPTRAQDSAAADTNAASTPPTSNDPLPPQDPPPEPKKEDGSTKLEKVVVTANKREQLLTDVPMAVSAISGKDLEKDGDRTFADYAQKIPSLDFGYYGEGRQRISIRGLQAPTGVSTVAYLVDGIDQSDSPPDPDLFDIDHIEVLRGPQGTLYGAGAVGGAIKILTNRANPYGFATKFLGSTGYNVAGAWDHDLNGMVNVPLISGELGVRAVAFERHADGFINVREPDFNNPPDTPAYHFKSYNSNNIVASNANTTSVKGGRAALDWKAGNDVTLGATYMVESSRIRWGPTQDIDLDQRYGGYNMVEGCACGLSGDITDHDYRQATFNLNWRLPFAQLESVTGMADVKEDLGAPLFIVIPAVETALAVFGQTPPVAIPAIPDPVRTILFNAGVPTQAAIGDMFDFRLINQWSYVSQEFRLLGTPSAWFPLTWTVGLFYKLENREAFEDVYAGPNLGPILAGGDGGLFQQVNIHFHTEEYAAYGQLEYAVTQNLSALAGVRVYRANLMDEAIGGGADGLVFRPQFRDVSPKFTLSYHLTDSVLGYATMAKGFRIGGVNFSTLDPPPPNAVRTYQPDVLWNYEVGVNSVLLDNRLSANFALFSSQWKNLQDEIIVRSNPTVDANGFHPGGQDREVINAAHAHSRGVEGEFSLLLPLDLTWAISGAYLDARIDQRQQNPATGDVIPEGTPLENVPHFAGNTSLTHELRFGNGWGLASEVSYTYRGKSISDITNPTQSRASAYRLLDLRFGVHGKSQAWSADLFAKNLLNVRASSFTFQNSGTPYTLPFHTDVPLAYRTLGVRLNYNFR